MSIYNGFTTPVLDEITELRKSEFVRLAIAAEQAEEALHAEYDRLQELDRRGRKLAQAGWTISAIKCLVEDAGRCPEAEE